MFMKWGLVCYILLLKHVCHVKQDLYDALGLSTSKELPLSMIVPKEDLMVLATLISIEHGDKASLFLEEYIDQLERTGDDVSVSLWRKITAFWYQEYGRKV